MKSEVFQLGDVRFEPSTRDLIDKDGRPVQLRNKSKAVLAYILQNPNQTVKKADILQNVWSEATVSDESLVQCIADIRRIVGADARKIVETVPREGYRINVETAPPAPARPRLALPAALVAAGLVAGWLLWPETAEVAVPEPAPSVADAAPGPPGTDHVEAYLEVLQGRVSANRFNKDESLIAERHFRRAIEIDPTYARAYAELGTLIAVRFENGWTVLHEADKEKALHYAEEAVALDPDLWLGHYALGRLHSVFSNLELAEQHLRTAMSLEPDNEDARAYLGVVLNFQGETDTAVAILEQAVASHPSPPYWYYFGLGHALFNAGRFADAEAMLTTCLEVSNQSPYCLRYLLAVYGHTGQADKAAAAGQTYAALGFQLSVRAILDLMTFHHPEDRAQLEAGLRLAGVAD